jgi:hypothetical protein
LIIQLPCHVIRRMSTVKHVDLVILANCGEEALRMRIFQIQLDIFSLI